MIGGQGASSLRQELMLPAPHTPAPPEHSPSAALSDIALFVDWENLRYSLREQEVEPNIPALMQAVGRYGRLVIARAYADWQDSSLRRTTDQANLYFAGIEPVFVPSRPDPRVDRRKNAVDMKMSADALEVSFTNPHIKTFLLVSGDADFLHVASSLRSRGRRVIMIGVSWSTSSRLSERVDDLIFYDQEIDAVRLPPEGSAPPPAGGSVSADLSALLDTIVQVLRLQRDVQFDYPPSLAWLNLHLKGADHDFWPGKYGFVKLRDLLRYAEQQGRVKTITRDMDTWVMLPEDRAASDTVAVASGPPRQDITGGGLPQASVRTASTPSGGGVYALRGGEPLLSAQDPLAAHPEVFADLARIAASLEAKPWFRYMTTSFLSQNLVRLRFAPSELSEPCGVPLSATFRTLRTNQTNKLVDMALEQGLLQLVTYTDPDIGRPFPIVRLNRAHPFAQQALAGTPCADVLAEAVPAPIEAVPAPAEADAPEADTPAGTREDADTEEADASDEDAMPDNVPDAEDAMPDAEEADADAEDTAAVNGSLSPPPKPKTRRLIPKKTHKAARRF